MPITERNMTDPNHGLSEGDESQRDVPSRGSNRRSPSEELNPSTETVFEDHDLEEQECVQVYLRLKPCRTRCNLYEVRNDRCLITSVDTDNAGHGKRTQPNVPRKMYTFSKIFGSDSSQKEIFEQLVKENLNKLAEGHNFNLITYGMSGSGKTYTVMGTVTSPGLVPMSLEYIFRIVDAAQQPLEIFEQVVKENLNKLAEGHNFNLITYGMSGSGKTYTVMGTVTSPGLVPMSLEYIFRIVDAAQQPLFKPSERGVGMLSGDDQSVELQTVSRLRRTTAVTATVKEKYRRMSNVLRNSDMACTPGHDGTRYYVWVSFVEIYNENIYDLLVSSMNRSSKYKLKIREDPSGNTYCKDATQVFVRSGEEAYDVMTAGKYNLHVAATGVHSNSSRSHCIFTITLVTEIDRRVRTSYMRLCDLAGSERAHATGNTGARMMESRSINSSLHVLEKCLHAMRRKQRADGTVVVPYRESRLTRLLGSALTGARGEALTVVVTLNPAPQYAHEKKHVLQLAAVAKDIQIHHNTGGEQTPETAQGSQSQEVLNLQADNERLRFELMEAQSRNQELLASMAEMQQEAEAARRAVEARDVQLDKVRIEMEKVKHFFDLSTATRLETQAENLMKLVSEIKSLHDEPFENENATNDDTITHDRNNESLEPSFTRDVNRSTEIRESSSSFFFSRDDNVDESVIEVLRPQEVVEVSSDELNDSNDL